ncbi:hypothetical protein A3B35_01985 [Candidatus Kaiserbacteria bacterium RIFCSPLOWO2_01_FULL_54_24]|uniref:Uncharacterized protein n=1 Tax=Candidatus Kaiserbacteria bacterium RIFCSPLOWO2_01_FULL_54_24 TaxID=1798515 RepID=A0A1F6ETA4_9BACT|nr:MAG: hypothetical protein A3B35_01985 [Candidatus Kaiserbacteria bacterium RIFCSPLOWO2_01_FULL_54_24]
MNYTQGATNLFRQRGMSPLGILFILVLILVLIFMFDMGFIFLSENCIDEGPILCALNMLLGEDEESAPQEGAVTAAGVVSGEYGGEARSVTVTLTFPLEGGAVSGSFSGDCDGNIKGTYAGGNGGAISGTGKGSCAFVIPASGQFSGTVNQSTKSVPVSGSGSAAGFSGEGSLTLTY